VDHVSDLKPEDRLKAENKLKELTQQGYGNNNINNKLHHIIVRE